ncbi:MAG: hypothetical protein ACRC68_05810 [Clostridium sp.]
MKCYDVAKYNLSNVKKSIIIFYAIFIAVCTGLVVMNDFANGSINSAGVELSTVIFLFVLGLNMFKESFYFSQSNNISRKTYFKGSILSIIPIALVLSLVDVIINRVYNIFVKCPTNYDMIFTNLRDIPFSEITTENNIVMKGVSSSSYWIQNNDISTLFNTYLLQASGYIMVIALGMTIALIYYKCNKLMKTVVSVTPILLIMIISSTSYKFKELSQSIGLFIENIFGWNTRNPYAAITTFICIFAILVGIIYLLVKKAVIKER